MIAFPSTILTVTKSLLSVVFNTIPFGKYILKFVPSSKPAVLLVVTVISKIPVSLSTSAFIVTLSASAKGSFSPFNTFLIALIFQSNPSGIVSHAGSGVPNNVLSNSSVYVSLTGAVPFFNASVT